MWSIPANFIGSKTLIFIVTDNGTPPLSDTDTVIIQVSAGPVNNPPRWKNRTITATVAAGKLFELPLADSCSDPDKDPVTFTLISGAPEGDTVVKNTYCYQPAADAGGSFIVGIVAADNKGATDTLTIVLTVKTDTSPVDSTPPRISRRTPGSDSTTVGSSTVALAVVVTDASGIATVACSMAGSNFSVSNADSVYSVTVTGLTAKTHNRIRFTATDKAGNCDSTFFYIYYDPTMSDHTPPALRRKNPDRDSTTVSSSTVAVAVVIMDASGIATVTCSMAGSNFSVSNADSVYSAIITGLTPGACNNIKFIATDASSNNNRDSIVICIRHDPTIGDNTAPVFNPVSGPASGSVLHTAAFTLVYEIKDDNGIDSVWWALNGNAKGKVNAGTNDRYTFTGNLTAPPHANRIVINATDKSYACNQGSIEIILYYNTLPSEVTATSPANNATGVAPLTVFTWTGGHDSDGDTVYYRVLYGTSETSLNRQTPEVKTGTVTIPEGDALEAYTKYYWQVIAYTKIYKDTVRSNVRSFTTAGVAPVITASPNDATVNEGSTLTLSVTATGIPAPTVYQWYKNGTPIPNETGPSYTKVAVTAADSGTYYVTVSNGVGSAVQSGTAKITVRLKPVIPGQPEPVTVVVGEDATFTITATGTAPLSYQWQRNQSVIPGATSNSYTLKTTVTNNGDKYCCIVTNAAGSATSNEARLTVQYAASSISVQPASQSIDLGSEVVFSVTATGLPTPTYQWKKNGVAIPGATSSTYRISEVWIADSGNYMVDVINSIQIVTSNTATLKLIYPVQVAAGTNHTLVRKNDGSLWVCGYNGAGQFGNGVSGNSCSTFIKIDNINNVTDIASGNDHNIMKAGGNLYTFGYNYCGQLGIGSTESMTLPTIINNVVNLKDISANFDHTIYTKQNGEVFACGENASGEMGDGTQEKKTSFFNVNYATIKTLVFGSKHSVALDIVGGVHSSGWNYYGQLGDGTKTNIFTPKRIIPPTK